jgi:hypothetical protein
MNDNAWRLEGTTNGQSRFRLIVAYRDDSDKTGGHHLVVLEGFTHDSNKQFGQGVFATDAEDSCSPQLAFQTAPIFKVQVQETD